VLPAARFFLFPTSLKYLDHEENNLYKNGSNPSTTIKGVVERTSTEHTTIAINSGNRIVIEI
jgi:hypothetical protein